MCGSCFTGCIPDSDVLRIMLLLWLSKEDKLAELALKEAF